MRTPLSRPFLLVASAVLCSFSALSASFSAPSAVRENSAFRTWRLEGGAVRTDATADDRVWTVGSLLKPFVVKAWARAHPGGLPPRRRCGAASGCWRPSGHGELGLARALAVSCNVYFRALAADTPPDILASVLREEGFAVPVGPSPEAAIGLALEHDAVTIRAATLLSAYVRLTREPWPFADDVRREVLAGLRDAATQGTARGLGRRGYWAKTGTVPALDGRALRTSGWAIAVDDAGSAWLGLLEHGTGREAARALGGLLETTRRSAAADATTATTADEPGVVSVSMLGALRPRAILARNAGRAPVLGSHGYVGPGGSLRLQPGDRLEPGLWDVTLPGRTFRRRVKGALSCGEGPDGTLRLALRTSPEEYVAGVLAAELDEANPDMQTALGAAVLRFLEEGARHADTTVCDQTHCAWFVGRGPRLLWPAPDRPVPARFERGSEGAVERGGPALEPRLWARIRETALRPGPARWTSHCGGAPLSAHAVWGNGDRRVWACARHQGKPAPVWRRQWTGDLLARAFGATIRNLEVADTGEVWTLRVLTAAGSRDVGFDETHRLLARVSGWDSLPSPATRVVRNGTGFEAEGVGSGHRVGLCLGE
jgi:stage II sporulation protein D